MLLPLSVVNICEVVDDAEFKRNFDKYEFKSNLGQGGFNSVFLVEDINLKTLKAMRFMKLDHLAQHLGLGDTKEPVKTEGHLKSENPDIFPYSDLNEKSTRSQDEISGNFQDRHAALHDKMFGSELKIDLDGSFLSQSSSGMPHKHLSEDRHNKNTDIGIRSANIGHRTPFFDNLMNVKEQPEVMYVKSEGRYKLKHRINQTPKDLSIASNTSKERVEHNVSNEHLRGHERSDGIPSFKEVEKQPLMKYLLDQFKIEHADEEISALNEPSQYEDYKIEINNKAILATQSIKEKDHSLNTKKALDVLSDNIKLTEDLNSFISTDISAFISTIMGKLEDFIPNEATNGLEEEDTLTNVLNDLLWIDVLTPETHQCFFNSDDYIFSIVDLGGPNLNNSFVKVSYANLMLKQQVVFLMKIAELVAILHEKNIVHCDISGDNIITKMDIENDNFYSTPYLIYRSEDEDNSTEIKKERQDEIIRKLVYLLEINENADVDHNLDSLFETIKLEFDDFMLIDFDGSINLSMDLEEDSISSKNNKGGCPIYKKSYFPQYELNEGLVDPEDYKTKDVFALGMVFAKFEGYRGNQDPSTLFMHHFKTNPNDPPTAYSIMDLFLNSNYKINKNDLEDDNEDVEAVEENDKHVTGVLALRYLLEALTRPNYHLLGDKANTVINKSKEMKKLLSNSYFEDYNATTEINNIEKVLKISDVELAKISVGKVQLAKLPKRITSIDALTALKAIYIMLSSSNEAYEDVDKRDEQIKYCTNFMSKFLALVGHKDTFFKQYLLEKFKEQLVARNISFDLHILI